MNSSFPVSITYQLNGKHWRVAFRGKPIRVRETVELFQNWGIINKTEPLDENCQLAWTTPKKLKNGLVNIFENRLAFYHGISEERANAAAQVMAKRFFASLQEESLIFKTGQAPTVKDRIEAFFNDFAAPRQVFELQDVAA
jgi:hypothetical protein